MPASLTPGTSRLRQHPDDAGDVVRRRRVEAGDARVGVRRLHRLGVQHVPGAEHQVVGVQRVPGDVQGRTLVLHRHADDGVLGSVRQLAHDSAPSFRSALPSMTDRNSALARWSEIGVPSPASTRAADSMVSSSQGLPSRACSVAVARIGVAATPPRPMRALVTAPSSMSSANATATLLMSSNGRLAILWNAVVVAAGRGTTTSVISSPAARTDSRYPVKYSASGTVRTPSARGEHHARLQGQQHRRRVADRGSGAQVAAEGGAVADQPRGELREQGGEQRQLAPDSTSRRSISLNVRAAPIRSSLVEEVGASNRLETPQLVEPVDGHDEAGPGALEVHVDTPVRAAGDDRGLGFLGENPQCLLEIGWSDELRLGVVQPGRYGGRRGRRTAGGQRVVGGREAERVGSVLDGAVPGAPAEVAAERVEVEAVVAVVGVVLLGTGAVGGLPRGAVELGRHAAHEPRCAVAALRTAADGHLVLDRVQVVGSTQALGGDDLLAVEAGRRDEAGVDRGPVGGVGTVGRGPCDQDRARAALTLGAALLGPGQSACPQEVQRVGVQGHPLERSLLAVHHDPGHPHLPGTRLHGMVAGPGLWHEGSACWLSMRTPGRTATLTAPPGPGHGVIRDSP